MTNEKQPKEKTGHAVSKSFDDPRDIVDFINEHHIKKEDIVGITRRDSVCLGSNLFKYYLIYFGEEEECAEAEWISKDISDMVYCSKCDYREWYTYAAVYNYCPICGRKMKKKGENDD